MNNEPVAWAMFKGNTFMDAIHPDEHTRFEGGYTIPLYTHPAKTLTDEEINKLWAESHEDGIAMQQGFTTQQHYFARLILRKAQSE